MLALHIALWALLGTCLAFSIIELGLVAYVASIWGGTQQIPNWDPYQGYVYPNIHVETPGIVDFLLFSACWSILASAAAVVLPWFYTRKGAVTTKLNTILGISSCVVFFITSVFWLAGFADIASLLDGWTSTSDYLNAVIAFAVLLWYVGPSSPSYVRRSCCSTMNRQALISRPLHPRRPRPLRSCCFRLGRLSIAAQDSHSRWPGIWPRANDPGNS